MSSESTKVRGASRMTFYVTGKPEKDKGLRPYDKLGGGVKKKNGVKEMKMGPSTIKN